MNQSPRSPRSEVARLQAKCRGQAAEMEELRAIFTSQLQKKEKETFSALSKVSALEEENSILRAQNAELLGKIRELYPSFETRTMSVLSVKLEPEELLGITLSESSAVTTIIPNSAADRFGAFRIGDRVVSVNGQEPRGDNPSALQLLQDSVAKVRSGTKSALVVLERRDGGVLSLHRYITVRIELTHPVAAAPPPRPMSLSSSSAPASNTSGSLFTSTAHRPISSSSSSIQQQQQQHPHHSVPMSPSHGSIAPPPPSSSSQQTTATATSSSPVRAGLGITFHQDRFGRFIVKRLTAGGAAEVHGGIRTGDIVMTIDGHRISGATPNMLGQYVVGLEGSICELGVLGPGGAGPMRYLELVRRQTPKDASSSSTSRPSSWFGDSGNRNSGGSSSANGGTSVFADLSTQSIGVDEDIRGPFGLVSPRDGFSLNKRPPSGGATNSSNSSSNLLHLPLPNQQNVTPSTTTTTSSSSSTAGIGITFKIDSQNRYVVKRLTPGGAAALSGIVHIGDVLVSVSGKSSSGISQSELARLIIGPEGSTVEIGVIPVGNATAIRHIILTRRVTPKTAADATSKSSVRPEDSLVSMGVGGGENSIDWDEKGAEDNDNKDNGVLSISTATANHEVGSVTKINNDGENGEDATAKNEEEEDENANATGSNGSNSNNRLEEKSMDFDEQAAAEEEEEEQEQQQQQDNDQQMEETASPSKKRMSSDDGNVNLSSSGDGGRIPIGGSSFLPKKTTAITSGTTSSSSSQITANAGLGMTFRIDRRGRYAIKRIIPDGAAANSGRVRVGDVIVSISGVRVAGLAPKELARLVIGRVGSVVDVEILSGGVGIGRVVPMTRVAVASSSSSSGGPAMRGSVRAVKSVMSSLSVVPEEFALSEMSVGSIGERSSIQLSSTRPLSSSSNSSGSSGGSKAGLGIVMYEDARRRFVVKRVLPGGSAAKSGCVSVGDIILSINAAPTLGLSVAEVARMIVGELGSYVELELVSKLTPSGQIVEEARRKVLLERTITPREEPTSSSSSSSSDSANRSSISSELSINPEISRESIVIGDDDNNARNVPSINFDNRNSNGAAGIVSGIINNNNNNSNSPQRPISLTSATTTTTSPPTSSSAGLGMTFFQLDGDSRFFIKRLVEGGSAARSGLVQVGDILSSIDGVSVANMSQRELATHILGPEGSTVYLQLQSARDNSTRSVVLVRSRTQAS